MARKALIEKQKRKQKFSTREYNRCKVCGRPHGYLRKYGVCRICFRELAHKGQIPGVRKASWRRYYNMMTDPIADMLTRIRNSNDAKKDSVDIPASNIKEDIARILLEEGYINGYEIIEEDNQGTLRIALKYGPNKEKVLSNIKRISKPGLRVYTNKNELPRVLGGLGTAIVSTSKGVMADKDARKENVGGEVICYVW